MQSIVVTLDISLELCAELGEYLSVSSVPLSSNEIPAFITHSMPFMSWFSAAVLASKFIPKLRHRKNKCEGSQLNLEPQARAMCRCPGPEVPWKAVILRITRCFLLSSRCPAHGLCLAAAQRHHGKERFSPCWLLLPHLLKEKKPARLLPCPQISRAATGAGISPKWHRRSLFTSTPFCNHTCQGMLILLSVLHSILGGKAFQSSKIPGEDLPLSNQRIEADPLTHASSQY